MNTGRNTWLVLILGLAAAACTGDRGPKGDPGSGGSSAPTTGIIAGTVTDGIAHDALVGVAVTAEDAGGATLATGTTDDAGKFSVTVPAGPVQLAFAKDLYTSPGLLASGVGGGQTVQVAVTMNEAASGKPSLSLAVSGDDLGYGAQVPVTATAADPNGDLLTYTWSNTTEPLLGGVTGSGPSGTIALPEVTDAFSYRPDPLNPGQFISGYLLQDRFGIVPIMPDTRGSVTATVQVDDGRGQTASASITVNAASVTTSVRDLPIGQMVYVNSGHDGENSWTLTVTPADATQTSAAALNDPTVRTPWFRPDVKGQYTLTEGSNSITITADAFYGMVAGGSGNDVEPDSQCLYCHQNLALPNIPNRFTEYTNPITGLVATGWNGTAHGTTFARGVNGALSNHFSGACAGCHTTGDDPGVANGGFDDVLAADDWKFPTTYSPTNWQDMLATSPSVARLANIQCESCHGPQGGPVPLAGNAHGSTWDANRNSAPWQSARISFAAEVCGTCHAAGGDHIYSEWATPAAVNEDGVAMGHSNRAGAKNAVNPGLNTSCGRCHSAQGYSMYSTFLKAQTPIVTLTCKAGSGSCDPLLPSAATLAQVTAANVEPVTCAACHDPHDATHPNQLRIYNDVAMTPAGFGAFGMGKGALCISCHNSRNGTISTSDTFTFLHEDTDAYSAGAPLSYSAPHQADQGDVFMGHNAYFMGAALPMTSKHAAITDTCVGCHMTLQPETFISHGTPSRQSHLFRITDANKGELCANCHGATVDGEAIQAQVEAQLASLQSKVSAAFKARVATVGGKLNLRAYDPATDSYSSASGSNVLLDTTGAVKIVSASFVEVHGQISLDITLNQAIAIPGLPAASYSEFSAQLGDLKDNAATPAVLYALTGNFTKAGWNYFLIEGDQSKGLHNPSFVSAVMNTTLAKDLSN